MNELRCKAILFDMDGTLVDSTACVETLWQRWGARHGIALADILAVSHGCRTVDTMRSLAPQIDCVAEARAFDTESVDMPEGIVALAGARALLERLGADQWAVVTSAPHDLAEARLRYAGLPRPTHLIGAEDVHRGKPDPEGYLLAAARLGVSPEDCIVVEDTPAGILAARTAGMRVVAIGTTVPQSELLGADWVRDFEGLAFTLEMEPTAPTPAAMRH